MLRENGQLESKNNENPSTALRARIEKGQPLAEVKAKKEPISKKPKNIERTKQEEKEISNLKAELLENYNEKENQDVLEEIHISPEVKDDDKPKDEKKGFKGLIGKF